MSDSKQTQIVSVIDLDITEREDIERAIQKAVEVNGYLHIKVRVAASGSASAAADEPDAHVHGLECQGPNICYVEWQREVEQLHDEASALAAADEPGETP